MSSGAVAVAVADGAADALAERKLRLVLHSSNNAWANCLASKGCRSSGCSPRPMNLIGQAEFLLDRDDHAAFAGAVELGDDQAGERDGLVEFARLVQGVHAGGGVEHQQHFVRRAGQLLAHDAVHLLQFLHQVVLGVQAARRCR